MKLLLDTTVLIDMMRGKLRLSGLLQDSFGQGVELATTTVNVGEVFSGLRPVEKQIAEAILGALEIYPLTTAVARKAGELRYSFARKEITLGLPDTIVAATALHYGLTLMTENRKDFPMPDLQFFDLP